MGRLGTALVVGGILVLGVLAAADAFRSGGANVVAESTTSTVHPQGRPTLAGTLAHDAIQGTLIYSDERCGVRSILLPSLHRDLVTSDRTGKQVRGCTFSFAAGHFLRGKVAVSGDTVARCSKGGVIVRNVVSNSVLAKTGGCPVAWRELQNGASQLTRSEGGAIVSDHHVLVSRAELARAARKHPNLIGLDPSIPLRVSVFDFAWLDEHRVVAILHASGRGIRPETMLVLLDGGHLTGVDVRFEGPMRNLVVSPGGAYAADEPGTLMRARDGRSWALPRSPGIEHVLAFSPDERWLAISTRTSVFVISVTDIERNEPEPRIDRVPIAAQDLVWEPGGISTDTSTTVR
jgi:hypothetical protein